MLYPVFTAARSNLIAVPGILMLGTLLLWPVNTSLWGFAGVLSFLGANLVNILLTHEVFPRISWSDSFRQSTTGFLQTTLRMTVLVAAVILMPGYVDLQIDCFAILIVLIALAWVTRVSSWFATAVGLFVPAPERVLKIAHEISAKMKIPYRRILLIRSPRAHAFAFPGQNLIVFTQRLLDLLTDAEVAAVCAHEMAHLSESRGMRLCRYIGSKAFLPWIFVSPLFNRFGPWALLFLVAITVSCLRLSAWISRKLEVRADCLAKATEGELGVYARALARLYEDNLVPAVLAGKQRHPDLYDRLLAAGLTPNFPRPSPARSMAWHGRLLAGLAGLLAVLAILIPALNSRLFQFNN